MEDRQIPEHRHDAREPHPAPLGEGKKSKAMYILIVLAVGLLIFSAVQTFQINGLEESVITGGSVGAGRSAVSGAPQRPAASSPRMVGGC